MIFCFVFGLVFGRSLGGPWTHFGSHFWSILGFKFRLIFGLFFWAFFDWFFKLFYIIFCSKIVPESKKTILRKWASRVHEVLIFKDLGAQNPSQNDWKINRKCDDLFDGQKYRKIIKMTSKITQQTSQDVSKNRANKKSGKWSKKRPTWTWAA